MLHDARPGHERLTRFASPNDIIRADVPDEVAPALQAVARAQASGFFVAGYFSYEMGYVLEPRLRSLLWDTRSVPLLWFGVFREAEQIAGPSIAACLQSFGQAYAGMLENEWDEAAYKERFDRVHEWISAGDIYQANLSFRSRFRFAGTARALYADLARQAAAGHCAFVDDGARAILSFSPELFFDLTKEGRLTVRPMKGTAPRGDDPVSDERAKTALAESAKDRAENLMIVDLLRNDLGRVAEIGSVKVENLFAIETYPTLHQMVSTVTAQCVAGTSVETLVRALFPCGSITGAPKIRAMEIIRATETSPRGVYCGAIGHFAPDGGAQFNVAIRTLTIDGNKGELGVGGAVVHDSTSRGEYEECLLKARYYNVGRKPLKLIETLRYEPGGFVRLQRHLARMAASADTLGLPFVLGEAMTALDDAVAHASTAMRVRLTLDEAGHFECSAAPLASSKELWRFAISSVRVESQDVLLQHKTDRRELFEKESQAAAAQGFDEVVFLNERGELTEGSRTNLFVRLDGHLVTPPLSAGLLNGCLRQEMLEQQACREWVLSEEDLERAEEIYLGNSLRGLIAATLCRSS